ncbi:hypothetical protein H8E77_14960 [bacterium]|nr:hypothetical protein [bacterium]
MLTSAVLIVALQANSKETELQYLNPSPIRGIEIHDVTRDGLWCGFGISENPPSFNSIGENILENLRDFTNRFTHTHEGENILRAYQVMFPQQFEEAVRNTVILEEILDDQEPALEALTKVGGTEYLMEETTIKNLQVSDLMKKRSPVYRKIDKNPVR